MIDLEKQVHKSHYRRTGNRNECYSVLEFVSNPSEHAVVKEKRKRRVLPIYQQYLMSEEQQNG